MVLQHVRMVEHAGIAEPSKEAFHFFFPQFPDLIQINTEVVRKLARGENTLGEWSELTNLSEIRCAHGNNACTRILQATMSDGESAKTLEITSMPTETIWIFKHPSRKSDESTSSSVTS